MNSESGLVLRRLREAIGKTQEEVAHDLGSSQKLVSRHEIHGQMGRKSLARYAEYYGVGSDVILGLAPIPQGYSKEYRNQVREGLPTEIPKGVEYYSPGPIVLLPVYDQASAGAPMLANERPIDRRAVDASRVQHDLQNFVLLRVEGDSMILDGIMPGALVLVHLQNSVDDNQIAVARVRDDGITIKRYKRMSDGSVLLVPRNPYMREESYPYEDVHVIGRVVSAITDFE